MTDMNMRVRQRPRDATEPPCSSWCLALWFYCCSLLQHSPGPHLVIPPPDERHRLCTLQIFTVSPVLVIRLLFTVNPTLSVFHTPGASCLCFRSPTLGPSPHPHRHLLPVSCLLEEYHDDMQQRATGRIRALGFCRTAALQLNSRLPQLFQTLYKR